MVQRVLQQPVQPFQIYLGLGAREIQLDAMLAYHNDIAVAQRFARDPLRINKGTVPALEIDNNDRVLIANQKSMPAADKFAIANDVTNI